MKPMTLRLGQRWCGKTTGARRRGVGFAVTAALWMFCGTVFAQAGNRDYYSAGLTQENRELLKNVEQFHIGPAQSRMAEHNYGSALGDIEFILGFFPNHPRGLMLLSELCDLKWKDRRCNPAPWFEKAIARNPSIAMTYLAYGIHRQRRSDLAGAVERYEKAVSLDPTSANAHYNLGLGYFEQKKYDLANQHAQASYDLGMPLPGLKDKLTRAGQWKPVDPEMLKKMTAVSDQSGKTPSAEEPKPQ